MTLDPAVLSTLVTLVVGASTILKIVKALVMVLFVLSAIVLIAVVLLQEGKGGGIAGAFGGAAADTFGVKAGTVNRFTTILASAFIGLALLHAGISSAMGDSAVKADEPVHVDTPPAVPPAVPGGGAPGVPPVVPPGPAMDDAMGGGAPPAPPAPPPAEKPADGMGGDTPPAPPAEKPTDPPK